MTRWLLLAVLAACAGVSPASAAPGARPADADPSASVEPFAAFVAPGDSLPRLRFLADGKISLNDRCPVRKVRLNPKMGASYVNGQPVGFC